MATATAARPVATSALSALPGVGPALISRLALLGISRPADLLLHLPLRFEDRSRVRAIAGLREGEAALIRGRIEAAELGQGRRRALLVSVTDASGALTLRFFHFRPAQTQQLRPGLWLECYGEVRSGPFRAEMVHPDYRLLPGGPDEPLPQATLTPVYPSTAGLTQATLRRLIGAALGRCEQFLPELLPAGLRQAEQLPDLPTALRRLHQPPATALDDTPAALHRLAIEELLAHHLSLRQRRRQRQTRQAPPLVGAGTLRERLAASLPFALTAAQRRVIGEALADLARPHPMLRLLQGDVGSGKTLVAAAIALEAVEAGWQAAIMAPTELLAEQHFRNFCRWLPPLGIDPVWLAGRHGGRTRAGILEAIASGRAPLVVGTHALFQDDVQFARLGLVIIDEQHRFGVHQRLALRAKGDDGRLAPHQLIMTATPIPRSLAMTFYADLDTSVIDELPPGRTPVDTRAVSRQRKDELLAAIAATCARGEQAYWVCPLIDESEALALSAATATAEELAAALPQLRVGLLHGRMKSRDKETVMGAFQRRETDLLVATTVIEVGVDVPNASLMIIDHAERLGLAQLHQLRGRVGRGSAHSRCVLLYEPQLSGTARARLAAMRETGDGFEIARRDLDLRGPGELLGTRQTGEVNLRVADLARDRGLLPRLPALAARIEQDAPSAVPKLIDRWLGRGLAYGEV
ncbi:MAG: ATP-dependent DNA helicase RecG [Immundisolibacter sp.]|uniref:ATP-dependent DNA helicase RecG n=1 Tax=Immundisolibacter sp. TaxID=1934948 RepID=UPI003D0D07C9